MAVPAAQAQDRAYRLSIDQLIAASPTSEQAAGLRALLEPRAQ
ncbi:hypothetical protein FHR51_003576 [Xanthomonas arboricola]|nr:hypothetical protein [Xanthomonas cannabis]MBB3807400.1 hypothetical protein [Xanthomonas cannabis]